MPGCLEGDKIRARHVGVHIRRRMECADASRAANVVMRASPMPSSRRHAPVTLRIGYAAVRRPPAASAQGVAITRCQALRRIAYLRRSDVFSRYAIERSHLIRYGAPGTASHATSWSHALPDTARYYQRFAHAPEVFFRRPPFMSRCRKQRGATLVTPSYATQ